MCRTSVWRSALRRPGTARRPTTVCPKRMLSRPGHLFLSLELASSLAGPSELTTWGEARGVRLAAPARGTGIGRKRRNSVRSARTASPLAPHTGSRALRGRVAIPQVRGTSPAERDIVTLRWASVLSPDVGAPGVSRAAAAGVTPAGLPAERELTLPTLGWRRGRPVHSLISFFVRGYVA